MTSGIGKGVNGMYEQELAPYEAELAPIESMVVQESRRNSAVLAAAVSAICTGLLIGGLIIIIALANSEALNSWSIRGF